MAFVSGENATLLALHNETKDEMTGNLYAVLPVVDSSELYYGRPSHSDRQDFSETNMLHGFFCLFESYMSPFSTCGPYRDRRKPANGT